MAASKVFSVLFVSQGMACLFVPHQFFITQTLMLLLRHRVFRLRQLLLSKRACAGFSQEFGLRDFNNVQESKRRSTRTCCRHQRWRRKALRGLASIWLIPGQEKDTRRMRFFAGWALMSLMTSKGSLVELRRKRVTQAAFWSIELAYVQVMQTSLKVLLKRRDCMFIPFQVMPKVMVLSPVSSLKTQIMRGTQFKSIVNGSSASLHGELVTWGTICYFIGAPTLLCS